MIIKNKFKIFVVLKLMLFLSISTYVSTAQNIKGTVFDVKLHKPLEGVNIYIKSQKIGTITNNKGEFQLNNSSEIYQNDTLYFSIVGYTTRKLTLHELKADDFVVMLSESVQLLKEVTIVSSNILYPQIRYHTLAQLKNGLYSFGSVLVGDKIWVIGGDESDGTGLGLKEITPIGSSYNLKMPPTYLWENYSDKQYVYDMQTDKWITSKLKFSKRAYHNIHYYNDKIYVLGGKTLSINRKFEYLDDKIEVYDINHNTILVDHTNPHQAINFASFVYNDNIIVMGGSTRIKANNEKEYSSKVHLLNLKTGLWYELKDMPVAKETKGVLINNTIYLIGGSNLKPLDNIESYNIATGEWKVEGQLFSAAERPAVTYNENIIYIFEDGIMQTYNIATKELKMYSIDLPLKSSELFYADNMLYIFGGSIGDDTSVHPSSDLYSIDLSEFNKAEIYSSKTF